MNKQRLPLAILMAALAAILIGSAVLRNDQTPAIPPTPTQRPTDLAPEQVIRRMPSIGYGVQAFLWWDEFTRQRDLEFIRMMRFQYVKQIFSWKDIRPLADAPPDWTYADEVVAEAEYRGINMIARLGKPPDWALRQPSEVTDPPFDVGAVAAFCGDLAARYKGRIMAYQVWNETNLAREWANHPPNAAAYVKVLKACATAIRQADPAALIISAPMAPTGTHIADVIPDEMYLLGMYEAGAKEYFDILGLNAPGYKGEPETSPSDPIYDGQRWQAFRHVEDMRAIMVAQGDGAKQVAILEMGWTVDQRESVPNAQGTPIPNGYRWHAVTEAQQADFLLRAYAYAGAHWRPWVSLMITIYLPDSSWTQANEEWWWALFEAGYTPRMRPAFFALANGPRFIDDQTIPAIDPDKNPYTPMPPRRSTP
jgi:polysaccharide biosynthesis protein PslG